MTGPHARADDPHSRPDRRRPALFEPATADLTRRRATALLTVAAACLAALVVIYVLVVHTSLGQHLDNDALFGRSQNPRVQRATDHLLHTIDVVSVTVLGGAIVLAAIARARLRLAVGAGTLLVAALVTTEALKHTLPRPELAHPDPLPVPSYPSGHTTVAVSLALALLLVVPARWRALVAIVGSLYGAGVGAATVTAGWHRPSDVVGAFLVTTGWAAAVSAVLVAEWGPGSLAARQRAWRAERIVVPLLAVAAVFLTVVGFAVASTVGALGDRRLQAVKLGAAYAGSVTVIFALGAASVAALVWCLRDVSLDDPDRQGADGRPLEAPSLPQS